jgi:hypothetical protein
LESYLSDLNLSLTHTQIEKSTINTSLARLVQILSTIIGGLEPASSTGKAQANKTTTLSMKEVDNVDVSTNGNKDIDMHNVTSSPPSPTFSPLMLSSGVFSSQYNPAKRKALSPCGDEPAPQHPWSFKPLTGGLLSNHKTSLFSDDEQEGMDDDAAPSGLAGRVDEIRLAAPNDIPELPKRRKHP